jgi:hypothetical protein
MERILRVRDYTEHRSVALRTRKGPRVRVGLRVTPPKYGENAPMGKISAFGANGGGRS